MNLSRDGNPRIGWLTAVLVLLAIIALGVPGRLLTQWSYAVERGKLQAGGEELAALNQDLAGVREVSHAFRLVARLARPGVVHIHVSGDETAHDRILELSRERAEIIERLEQAQEQVESDAPDKPTAREILRLHARATEIEEQINDLQDRYAAASGSGIIFDDEGHILTNNHVVAGRQNIVVRLLDEREHKATLIGNDPQTDLAVIRIDAPDLHPLKFGDSDRMEVGDWVIAVGAPFELSQSVTHGIISATGRDSVRTLVDRGIIYQNFLQTDAAINPGNSGGPLLNLRGEVIGVNTAIATNGDGYNAGIAFTIPANMAVKIANQLKQSGEVARGWLGISMWEMSAADREIYGVDSRRGVLVNGVFEDGPADAAGLMVEDVILKVDGAPVASMAQLRALIADIFPGEQATFDLMRAGRHETVKVNLSRRSNSGRLVAAGTRELLARPIEILGVYARTLLPDFARRNGFSADDRGVLVLGTIDEASGPPSIATSELIVGCNGKSVRTIADLESAFTTAEQDQPIRLEVVSPQGQRRTVSCARP